MFLSQLYSEVVVEGVENKLIWKESNVGVFSVVLMYKGLQLSSCELFS